MNRRKFFSSLFAVGVVGATPFIVKVAKKLQTLIGGLTKKKYGVVPKYNQSYWFREAARLRTPGTKNLNGGWKTDISDTFYQQRYSFRYEITD